MANTTTEEKPLPPMAPGSLARTLKALMGNEYPTFVKNAADELGTHVFRVNKFVDNLFGAEHFIVVGEPKLALEILN